MSACPASKSQALHNGDLVVHTCNLNSQMVKPGILQVQDHLWLHGKLKAILGIHEIHHHCRRRRHRHHHHLDKSGIQTLPTAYATSSRRKPGSQQTPSALSYLAYCDQPPAYLHIVPSGLQLCSSPGRRKKRAQFKVTSSEKPCLATPRTTALQPYSLSPTYFCPPRLSDPYLQQPYRFYFSTGK